MADEDKLKVQSLPPPPTDEIDEEWGSSGAASASPEKASEGSAAKSAGSKGQKASEQPKKKAARPEPEPDEDEDDDEDDDDEDDDVDEDSDDDVDESDDDDDDDDDEPPRKAKAASASAFDDLIPDWAPWGMLGGLLLFGFLGGTGIIPVSCSLTRTAASAAPATTTTAPATKTTTTTTARPTAARSARPPTPEDGEMVAASHLLVAYKGALRAAPTTTRTKEEAMKRATEAQKKAKKGADFGKLVGEYSDEPGAAERGGSLGKFTRKRMVKEFADAAFAMKVGAISDVVETQFGYHVIKRTE